MLVKQVKKVMKAMQVTEFLLPCPSKDVHTVAHADHECLTICVVHTCTGHVGNEDHTAQ